MKKADEEIMKLMEKEISIHKKIMPVIFVISIISLIILSKI